MSTDSMLAQRIREVSKPLDPIPTETEPRLSALPDIRCVLFDIYGTLFISGSGDVGTAGANDQQQALEESLAAVGLKAEIRASRITEIIRTHHERARSAGTEYPEVDIISVWGECLTEPGKVSPPRNVLRQLAIEYEARVNPVWPMPGLEQVLRELVARNIKLGIVSNAQFFTPLLFRAFLQQTHEDLGFDEILCAWSYRFEEAKPSKNMFRKPLATLDEWGFQPDSVVYVGNDMRNDIWPASELGCRTALFAGDQRSLRLRADEPDVAGVEPDVVLTELSQLLDVMA